MSLEEINGIIGEIRAEMVQIVEGNISEYEELEKARAKLQLMSELQKGRLSGENEGWISEEGIKR